MMVIEISPIIGNRTELLASLWKWLGSIAAGHVTRAVAGSRLLDHEDQTNDPDQANSQITG